ncbi:MAG: pilus assembly protein TadG-related protein [Thermoanaerobaculia bacterium]
MFGWRSRHERHRREGGQVLVFFLLIFITMILVGVLAVAGGQMLVRRQQAQMVADAAAFSGASRQAEGLNSIANINKDAVEALFEFSAAYAYGTYIAMDGAFWAWRMMNPISFTTGRFYENNQDEVRFAYFGRVSSSPVIFGRTFFKDLPPITVAAAAKPYGGYLGDTFVSGSPLSKGWSKGFPWPLDDLNFNPFGFPYTEQSGKEASATYKAKLVPLTTQEIAALALRIGDTEDPARWLTVLH